MSQQIQHLYLRAGFGISPTQLLQIEKQSLPTVVQGLFASSASSPTPLLVEEGDAPNAADLIGMTKDERRKALGKSQKAVRELNVRWFATLGKSEAQLREKMAFFWHGHFACQPKNIYHAQKYVQVLREKALGKFQDLVLAIAQTPAMLMFLNNQQNRKRSPNENFARELMELFTLGRGNYTEKDIKESARAFTGWGVDGDDYAFRAQFHDYSEKTFMGQTGDWNGEDIIKMILKKPETAQFIVRKLYRFLVNEGKSDEKIIKQLAQIFYESDYDISALLRAIFKADWFYDKANIGAKIKSPIELLVGMQRQFGLTFPESKSILFMQKILGQILLVPPNVAGWAGGRNWIDSSSLLFRLHLPQALYKAQEIAISAKEDGDVNTADMIDKRLQRFKAEFDWSGLEKLGKERLLSYLLQKPNNALKDALQGITDFREWAIAISATPEYQMM
jgi:uncharacterized protein (DUF1800 family)